jgi:hypothetical protein
LQHVRPPKTWAGRKSVGRKGPALDLQLQRAFVRGFGHFDRMVFAVERATRDAVDANERSGRRFAFEFAGRIERRNAAFEDDDRVVTARLAQA